MAQYKPLPKLTRLEAELFLQAHRAIDPIYTDESTSTGFWIARQIQISIRCFIEMGGWEVYYPADQAESGPSRMAIREYQG